MTAEVHFPAARHGGECGSEVQQLVVGLLQHAAAFPAVVLAARESWERPHFGIAAATQPRSCICVPICKRLFTNE